VEAKLHLVDLAGSERLSKSGATGGSQPSSQARAIPDAAVGFGQTSASASAIGQHLACMGGAQQVPGMLQLPSAGHSLAQQQPADQARCVLGPAGERLHEACAINQGLLALGNVIEALSDSKRPHVPYRQAGQHGRIGGGTGAGLEGEQGQAKKEEEGKGGFGGGRG